METTNTTTTPSSSVEGSTITKSINNDNNNNINNNNDKNKSSSTSHTHTQHRRTFTDFVESSFAKVERLCNPISSGAFDAKKEMNKDQESLATINETKTSSNTSNDNNKSNGTTTTKTTTTKSSKKQDKNNSDNEEDDEDEEAFATLTYLCLLSSLYLPLLLFLWIRRSMFGTASLCRSLFFGHMLRLIIAFTLLPPSTTKSFVPSWLWNLGVRVGHTAERVWNDKRTQKMIPTWFHLILAIVLGVENENIPSSLTLANLGGGGGSSSHHEKDSWPPPSLIALGIFTVFAFVVHPDGLTWIMLGQMRHWIQSTFDQTRDGIRMIRDGTIKITLAEMSGVIAGIIIVVTILRALINTSAPTEKVRTPHREKRGHKHKKGKKGKGGRHHHHHHNNQRSSDGGRSRIKSGHFRSSKDLYEATTTSTTNNNGSRSPSPSARDRSESDMTATAVSTLSDSGNIASFDISNEKHHIDSANQNKNGTKKETSEKLNTDNKTNKKSVNEEIVPTSVKSDTKKESQSICNEMNQNQKQKSISPKHLADRSNKVTTTAAHVDKHKRGNGRKARKAKHNNTSNLNEKGRHGNGGSSKPSTPNRTQNSHSKSQKSNSEERQRNRRVKDFECDITVGSTASCSMSESQSQYPRVQSGSKPNPISLNHESHTIGLGHNRRRSFTDPQASVSKRSLPPQCLSLNNSSIDQPLINTNEIEQPPYRSQQLREEVNGSFYVNSTCREGVDNQRIHSLHNNQMQSQQYGQFMGHNTSDYFSGSSNFSGGNGAVVRPPPGLAPQNSTNNSSMFARESVDSNQQNLPYLSSSTISTYSNFSTSSATMDTVGLQTSQTNEQFNMPTARFDPPQQRNLTLPPISPLNRNAPPPIGHERTKIHNEEEIEADLLALGGQMAGSILDF